MLLEKTNKQTNNKRLPLKVSVKDSSMQKSFDIFKWIIQE